jgi:hypothetical protein
MDIPNQSVLVDVALVLFHLGVEMKQLALLLGKRSESMISILMKEDEVKFWKHLLPAFAESCRQWQHKPSCEYMTTGRLPLLTDPDKHYVCKCGFNIFPKNYIKDVKGSKDLLKHAVRVAIPVIFASPINTNGGRSHRSPAFFHTTPTPGCTPKRGTYCGP